ncbi:hypothetical protein MASR2M17_23390 [Aminivibrio sp.]
MRGQGYGPYPAAAIPGRQIARYRTRGQGVPYRDASIESSVRAFRPLCPVLWAMRPAAAAAFACVETAAAAAADSGTAEAFPAASWVQPGVLSMLAVSLLCAVTAWHLVRRRRMRAEKASPGSRREGPAGA